MTRPWCHASSPRARSGSAATYTVTGDPANIPGHQQVTRDWWDTRSAFELYVSQFVLDEAGAGDAAAAKRRLAALVALPVLDLTREVRLVAGEILRHGGMPAKAFVDAVHVAVAAAHGVDYLLTWIWRDMVLLRR